MHEPYRNLEVKLRVAYVVTSRYRIHTVRIFYILSRLRPSPVTIGFKLLGATRFCAETFVCSFVPQSTVFVWLAHLHHL